MLTIFGPAFYISISLLLGLCLFPLLWLIRQEVSQAASLGVSKARTEKASLRLFFLFLLLVNLLTGLWFTLKDSETTRKPSSYQIHERSYDRF
jgi:hypothetical protein